MEACIAQQLQLHIHRDGYSFGGGLGPLFK